MACFWHTESWLHSIYSVFYIIGNSVLLGFFDGFISCIESTTFLCKIWPKLLLSKACLLEKTQKRWWTKAMHDSVQSLGMDSERENSTAVFLAWTKPKHQKIWMKIWLFYLHWATYVELHIQLIFRWRNSFLRKSSYELMERTSNFRYWHSWTP